MWIVSKRRYAILEATNPLEDTMLKTEHLQKACVGQGRKRSRLSPVNVLLGASGNSQNRKRFMPRQASRISNLPRGDYMLALLLISSWVECAINGRAQTA
jgi:hypothetical protein